jgi:TetR/AcrR family transcriptional regulator, transcriptional repressor for nem operon
MGSKAQHTSQYIVEKVAPVFNAHGYVGTSMSAITAVTGLTKGAVYGNFADKEELAVLAFKHNVRSIVQPLADEMAVQENAIDKLYALTKFYRGYYERVKGMGGCPVLNVGIDANHVNPALFKAVKQTAQKLEAGLREVIETGIRRCEIKKEADATAYARTLYAMIEGAVFMAFTHKDKTYITSVMEVADTLIREKLTA